MTFVSASLHLARPEDGQESRRSCSQETYFRQMRQKRELKTHRVNLKLSDSDYARMQALMDVYGYRSVSIFWRDLLNGKRFFSRRRVEKLTQKNYFDAMNRMTAQISLIGASYNQVVSHLEALSEAGSSDSPPRRGDAAVVKGVDGLQRLTQKLRDEVAVCIEMVDRYTRDLEGNTLHEDGDKRQQ